VIELTIGIATPNGKNNCRRSVLGELPDRIVGSHEHPVGEALRRVEADQQVGATRNYVRHPVNENAGALSQ
jgi:hypothetical protein